MSQTNMPNEKEVCPTTNDLITISNDQRRFASWMTAVLLYTVVLNLFVEYSDAIVIDSFTISVLTAIVLKALLDVIDILFREHVEIGGFIPLLVLIITMLVAELILQRIYDRLGRVKQSGLEATQSISDDHSQPRFAKCRYDLPRLRRS